MKSGFSPSKRAADPATPPGVLSSLAQDSTALARKVAGNPSAPAGLLDTLAAHEDTAVRGLVARHPNTEWETALKLIEAHAVDFVANPALDTYFVENPQRWFELELVHCQALWAVEPFRETLENGVLQHPVNDIRDWLAGVTTNPERLFILAHTMDSWVHWTVSSNPNTDARTLEHLASGWSAIPEASNMLEKIASHANVSPKALRRVSVAAKENGEKPANPARAKVRKLVARNRKSPADVLTRLAFDTSPTVRRNVAANLAAPVPALRVMVRDGARDVRLAVVRNPATPMTSLARMVNDRSPRIRNRVRKKLTAQASSVKQELVSELALLLTLKAAMDQDTPSDQLTMLGDHPSPMVREAVTRHSGTPLENLLKLAEAFPEAFLENPTFELLPLEDTGYLAKLPWAVVRILARQPSFPAESVSQLSEANRRLAAGCFGDQALLELLAYDEDEGTRAVVARNPSANTSLMKILAMDPSSRVRTSLTGNRNIPPEVLEHLARDNDSEVREAIAEDGSTPAETLDLLAMDEDEAVCRAAAENANTSSPTLVILANHRSPSVRSSVAQNPNTPPKTLDRLARDRYEVASKVTENPSASPRTLRLLAQHGNAFIRQFVSENPNMPVDSLEQLSRDKEEKVQLAVAKNPKTPVEILDQLATLFKDASNDLRSEFYLRVFWGHNECPAIPETLAIDPDPSVRSIAARDPKTPYHVLSQLAYDEHSHVKAAVAGNPSADPGVLKHLAKSAPGEVRIALAQNPSTPPQTLEQLACENHWHFRLAIAGNPKTPRKVLIRLVTDTESKVRLAALANLENHVIDEDSNPS